MNRIVISTLLFLTMTTQGKGPQRGKVCCEDYCMVIARRPCMRTVCCLCFLPWKYYASKQVARIAPETNDGDEIPAMVGVHEIKHGWNEKSVRFNKQTKCYEYEQKKPEPKKWYNRLLHLECFCKKKPRRPKSQKIIHGYFKKEGLFTKGATEEDKRLAREQASRDFARIFPPKEAWK